MRHTLSSTKFVDTKSLDSNCLSILPEELLVRIISYLEPRSTILTSLASVNSHTYNLMKRLGNTMVQNTRKNFTMLLPKLHSSESNLSLFIRHAQASYSIKAKCKQLKMILDSDFLIPNSSKVTSSYDLSECKDDPALNLIDEALSLSMELVAQDSLSYFLESRNIPTYKLGSDLINSKRMNLLRHCPRSVRRHILFLVRLCGIRVCKYLRIRNGMNVVDCNQAMCSNCINRPSYTTNEGDDSPDYYNDLNRLNIVRLLIRLAVVEQNSNQGKTFSIL